MPFDGIDGSRLQPINRMSFHRISAVVDGSPVAGRALHVGLDLVRP
jgi:hypothetical protein